MVIQIILNGETRGTHTVTAGIDPHDAKRLALAAAIRAGHVTISEALRVELRTVTSAS